MTRRSPDKNEMEEEIARLQFLVQQEETSVMMMETSYNQIKATVSEMEGHLKKIDGQSNEWKVRYDSQAELNQQLAKQDLLYQSRIEEGRAQMSKIRETPREELWAEYMQRISDDNMAKQETSQKRLSDQLRDLEMRLDQENKAFSRVLDEKKIKVNELQNMQQAILNVRHQQDLLSFNHLLASYQQWMNEDEVREAVKAASVNMQNIPMDRRILDTKMGPIRRTAAVKSLPRLNNGI